VSVCDAIFFLNYPSFENNKLQNTFSTNYIEENISYKRFVCTQHKGSEMLPILVNVLPFRFQAIRQLYRVLAKLVIEASSY